jgi:hypothetical protein
VDRSPIRSDSASLPSRLYAASHRLLFPVLLACCTAGIAQTASRPIYLDPSRPIDERVSDLIGHLTLEEKAQQLNHLTSYPSPAYWAQVLFGNHLGDHKVQSSATDAGSLLFWSATSSTQAKILHIKLVNATDQPQCILLDIANVMPGYAIAYTLHLATRFATNSSQQPDQIKPVTPNVKIAERTGVTLCRKIQSKCSTFQFADDTDFSNSSMNPGLLKLRSAFEMSDCPWCVPVVSYAAVLEMEGCPSRRRSFPKRLHNMIGRDSDVSCSELDHGQDGSQDSTYCANFLTDRICSEGHGEIVAEQFVPWGSDQLAVLP